MIRARPPRVGYVGVWGDRWCGSEGSNQGQSDPWSLSGGPGAVRGIHLRGKQEGIPGVVQDARPPKRWFDDLSTRSYGAGSDRT